MSLANEQQMPKLPIDELEQLEQLVPGSAERLLPRIEASLDQIIAEVPATRRANFWLALGPRLIGLAGWALALAASIVALILGYPWPAVAIPGAYGGAAIAVLVTGRRAIRTEVGDEAPTPQSQNQENPG